MRQLTQQQQKNKRSCQIKALYYIKTKKTTKQKQTFHESNMIFFVALLLFSVATQTLFVNADYQESFSLTAHLSPGEEKCFFQDVKAQDQVEVEFRNIMHEDKEILFTLIDSGSMLFILFIYLFMFLLLLLLDVLLLLLLLFYVVINTTNVMYFVFD